MDETLSNYSLKKPKVKLSALKKYKKFLDRQLLLEEQAKPCAKEAIHQTGSIQPHGFMLVIDINSDIITQVSSNILDAIPKHHWPSNINKPSDLINRKLSDFSPQVHLDLIHSLWSESKNQRPWHHFIPIFGKIDPQSWEVTVHISQGKGILELEARPQDESLGTVFSKLNQAITRIQDSKNLFELLYKSLEGIRSLTPFHRLMVYKFAPNWDGEVIAELREPHQKSFLNLRFPASDIPAQARQLYKKNWIRFIPNAKYQSQNILPACDASSKEPLDLSFSDLRSVSPIHLQYLANMGVSCSLSLSLILNGKLWGLIACHHEDSFMVSKNIRRCMENLARFFSIQLSVTLQEEQKQALFFFQEKLQDIASQMRLNNDFVSAVLESENKLLKLFDSSAGVLVFQNKIYRFGEIPAAKYLQTLIHWIDAQIGEKTYFFTSCLALKYPLAIHFAPHTCGILAIRIPSPETSLFIWIRPELTQEIRWAGNPYSKTGSESSLSPRFSYETWQETCSLHSTEWTPEDQEGTKEVIKLFTDLALQYQFYAERTARLDSEDSNKELDHFAYIISNGLQEPLNNFEDLAEKIVKNEGKSLKSKSKAHLDEMVALSRQVQEHISSFYTYSKIGFTDLSLTEVDIQETAQEAIKLLSSLIGKTKTKIHIDHKLPNLTCDFVRVQEIYLNLIENAIKHNPLEKKEVFLGVIQDSNQIILYCKDNGPGLNKLTCESLLLTQNLMERMKASKGSGLAIIRRLVEKHGGKVWIQSIIGIGTSVFFTLGSNSKKFIEFQS